jgi:hypothetical protein
MVLKHPRAIDEYDQLNQPHTLILDQLAALLGSPEKAGVGGSIPSLATIYNQ